MLNAADAPVLVLRQTCHHPSAQMESLQAAQGSSLQQEKIGQTNECKHKYYTCPPKGVEGVAPNKAGEEEAPKAGVA